MRITRIESMMRVCADDDMPKRITRQEQPGRALGGCVLVAGFLLPLALLCWALALRVTFWRW